MSLENLAMVFPGQGSQKVGMLSEFHEAHACFAKTFASASDVLGFDLWSMIQNGPEETINLTENTQPILLTSSVALWRVWQSLGGAKPALMAGHSLGEWSALVCAGVVSLEDAVKLVQLRGRYMQEAVPVGLGAMAAIIGLEDQAIIDICEKSQSAGLVSAVNFNAPGQVVIAGEKDAVAAASESCKEAGAKRALPLPVSAPFHTTMMTPAAERLAVEMESVTFNDPETLVVHNVTAKIESDAQAIKKLMIEQISAPVRWVECVQTLAASGITQAGECGPGKVLAGMVKRIDRSVAVSALETPASLKASVESLN